MSGEALGDAAQALVGTRYRLHGRDPATGLDCIGLLAAALTAIGRPAPLPTGYRLRARSLPTLAAVVDRCGFEAATGICQAGDVFLAQPGAYQFHLVIAGREERLIHAHAGLRRVAMLPRPLPWPTIHRWRLRQGVISWQP